MKMNIIDWESWLSVTMHVCLCNPMEVKLGPWVSASQPEELWSSETEVTPVQRLGPVPGLLSQNILYCGEGMQAKAIVLTHTRTHTLVFLWVKSYFSNPSPLNEPKS